MAARPFLTAEWCYLAMLSYRADPALLRPYVPRGTELDDCGGETLVSVVGFLFRVTRLLGLPVPFHRNFEELNLRSYVRRTVAGEVRRAVTFIKELVPRRAVAAVARLAYNEPYDALPMRHRLGPLEPGTGTPTRVEYAWRQRAGWGRLAVEPTGEPRPADAGSLEEFITERHWGYTRQRDGGTVEYRVEHPRWRVWPIGRHTLDADLAQLYGPAWAAVLAGRPTSALLADGSAVAVYAARRLPDLPARVTRDGVV